MNHCKEEVENMFLMKKHQWNYVNGFDIRLLMLVDLLWSKWLRKLNCWLNLGDLEVVLVGVISLYLGIRLLRIVLIGLVPDWNHHQKHPNRNLNKNKFHHLSTQKWKKMPNFWDTLIMAKHNHLNLWTKDNSKQLFLNPRNRTKMMKVNK